MNTTDMFRALHAEAPLGQLLGNLTGAAHAQMLADKAEKLSVQSRGQWHVSGREKSAQQYPQKPESPARGEWHRGRRASTQGLVGLRRPAKESGHDQANAIVASPHRRLGPPKANCPRALQPAKLLPDVQCRRAQESPTGMVSRPSSQGSRCFAKTITMLSGAALEANPRFRAYMEDTTNIIDPFMYGDGEGDQWGYYAIYDGHGGSDAVDYVAIHLHDVIFRELSKLKRGNSISDTRVSQALQRSFTHVDDQLENIGAWKCGSTATVALVRKSAAGLQLHVANVGDSSALVIDSNFQGHRISLDHRPTDKKEQLRVEAEGGHVARGRVNGQLAVSRALGDHYLKTSGVTGLPSVATRDVTDDLALVIASDGLWDFMRPMDVTRLFQQNCRMKSAEGMADLLVAEALRCGSTDNISCVVCLLHTAFKSSTPKA